MNWNYFFLFLFIVVTLESFSRDNRESIPINYLQTAEDFVTAVYQNSDDVYYLKTTLAKAMEDQLSAQLGTDSQKIAFWINVYNANIQDILNRHPEKYNDRNKFFNEKQILIAGHMLSFADIEHGILRRSKNQYSLGYFNKWRVSSFEKKMRVDAVDYRIHFALNCGAKSCPPVDLYRWYELKDQLDKSTFLYLSNNTRLDTEEHTAYVTALFSWFRGDFGGLKGIKQILIQHKIIPSTDIKLVTTPYDWTLDLRNFVSNMK